MWPSIMPSDGQSYPYTGFGLVLLLAIIWDKCFNDRIEDNFQNYIAFNLIYNYFYKHINISCKTDDSTPRKSLLIAFMYN